MQLTGEKNSFNGEIEIFDQSSIAQVEYAVGDDKSVSLSYMQTVTPFVTLGGSGTFSLNSKSLSTAIGGMYKSDETLVAFQWDDKVISSNKY